MPALEMFAERAYGDRGNLFFAVMVSVLIFVGVGRVVSTYYVFSHTWDETAHVACGMEWLDKGTFQCEAVTPPLARIATALGPYIAGVRSQGRGDVWLEGDDVLHANGKYPRNLALARVGVLPFFILASVIIYLWGCRYHGRVIGLTAVFLFTTSPTILAHAGIATVDMALTAAYTGAVFAFLLLLESPTKLRSFLLGLAIAIAFLCKFSAIVFLPLSLLAILFAWFMATKCKSTLPNQQSAGWRKSALIVIVTVFFAVWAGYRFSLDTLKHPGEGPYETVDRFVGKTGFPHNMAYAIIEKTPVPAHEFIRGIYSQWEHNKRGHSAYFMGEVRNHGWWYFFIVSLLVKTPIPFLVFAILGFYFLFRRGIADRGWQSVAPAVCSITILLIGSTGNLNLGIRYILPVYPMLALVAATGLSETWNLQVRRLSVRLIVVGLLVWQIASGVLAHPDYLPYANELAGSRPENVVVESDFDWGQDVYRLETVIQELAIKEIYVCVRGAGNINKNLSAITYPLLSHNPKSGWIAISSTRLKYDGTNIPPYDGYAWLENYIPVKTVGKTIKLFYIQGE
jgi:4-amino-4-deoxy-L-arabinose transferase-like glycosyltransferase